jgi:cytochrome c oxidase subunit 2/cytochrome aa3-600 menaquinol oxidase subunit 2
MNGDTGFRFFKFGQLADRVNSFFGFVIVLLSRHLVFLRRCVIPSLTLITLSGCKGVLSTVDPAGPAAQTIATLWWGMLAGAGLIFGLVMMLLLLAFRRNTSADEGGQVRVWVIGLGLVFPMIVLAGLLAYGLVIGERLLPRAGDDVVHVGAQGRLSAWSFTYADGQDHGTQNVLHIPAGRPVDVAITTTDVIHSFWVPRLAGKLDAIPGRVNTLRIEADLPGTYEGVSAEFSGTGYEGFTFTVIAHDAAGWDAFLKGESE